MDKNCKNCRFCIYAHSMRGKEEPYCERYSKWIGDTLLCSEWEMVNVPKPKTHADRIRSMSDEELAEWLEFRDDNCPRAECYKGGCHECWLNWLKQEAKDD